MADTSRDISAVIRIRQASDPSDAQKSDTAIDVDGARSSLLPHETISTADRTGVEEAASSVTRPSNNGSSNNGPQSNGPQNIGPSNIAPQTIDQSGIGSPKAAMAGPGLASNPSVAPDPSRQHAAPPPGATPRVVADPGRAAANPAGSSAAASQPKQAASGPASSQRRGNILFGALAVVAIAAAGISLTAPALRPELLYQPA